MTYARSSKLTRRSNVAASCEENFYSPMHGWQGSQGALLNCDSTEGVQFPDKPFIGADGILAQAFREAFVITTTDHSVLNKLLGKA
jgi:hypothetical protein